MIAIHIAAFFALGAEPGAAASLSYDDALAEALTGSSDLKAVGARLEQARTIGWKAWAGQLPRISATASWTRNEGAAEIPAQPPLLPEPIALQPLIARGAQVEARLPLFAPPLWFGIGAARAGQREAEWTAERARQEILFGAAELYHGAVAGRLAVQIAGRQLAVASEHEADARVRHQAGTTPRVALVRARIDRARAEQDLEVARAGYDAARLALATALDRKTTDFDVEMPPEPPLPAGRASEESAARERPDVRAAEAALESARWSRSSLWAGYLPTLGGFARAQWQDPPGLSGERRTWAAGLALTWNLFDGTLREAQLREAGAKVAEADAQMHSAGLRAREEVGRARLDLDAARANRKKAREQVELARENQKLVDVSFREGAATYLEVSDAHQQLFAAEQAAVGEQLKARLAALRLLRAAGVRAEAAARSAGTAGAR